VRAGNIGIALTDAQRHAIARRHTRLRRQALLRRLGLGKSHKPKILGANFSVMLRAFLAVNGFDETYRGYGQEDDDFVRRLYASGCRPAIGVRECMVYHQYHATRAPDDWEKGPNAAKFLQARGPARCVHGIDNPHMQSTPRFEWITPA
jgi:GT2 family glycosyltransferase